MGRKTLTQSITTNRDGHTIERSQVTRILNENRVSRSTWRQQYRRIHDIRVIGLYVFQIRVPLASLRPDSGLVGVDPHSFPVYCDDVDRRGSSLLARTAVTGSYLGIGTCLELWRPGVIGTDAGSMFIVLLNPCAVLCCLCGSGAAFNRVCVCVCVFVSG